MSVMLIPIDDDTRSDASRLKVRKDQERFVDSNDESLLERDEALSDGLSVPCFLIEEDGVPAGFAMLSYGRAEEGIPAEADIWYLWRFMIDERFQGRGIGKKALELILRYISESGRDGASVWVSYERDNQIARSLYSRAGFRETGDVSEGELLAVLE